MTYNYLTLSFDYSFPDATVKQLFQKRFSENGHESVYWCSTALQKRYFSRSSLGEFLIFFCFSNVLEQFGWLLLHFLKY